MANKYSGIMLVVLTAVMFSLFSCSGGILSSDTSTAPSIFAGNWSGTWNGSNGQSGTESLTIATDGTATGNIYNASTNQNASVSGSFSNAGPMNFTYTYPGPTVYTSFGTASINSVGALIGNFTEYYGGNPIGMGTFYLTQH